MLRISSKLLAYLAVLATAAACEPEPVTLHGGLPPMVTKAQERDLEHEMCRKRIERVKQQPAVSGAPEYDKRRVEVLGRAAGEPMVFVQAPPPAVDTPRRHPLAAGHVATVRARFRHDKAQLRARVLSGGYVYSDQPLVAHALVRQLRLGELFDAEEIYLQRGDRTYRLRRARARYSRGFEYRHTASAEDSDAEHSDGLRPGRTAKLLFGDRVAATKEELAEPLHRDVRGLRRRLGFERLRIRHHTKDTMVADLRYGPTWYTALLRADGAHLDLDCLDADAAAREAFRAALDADATRRRAIASLQTSADALVGDHLPFDRPRNAEDHFSDGQLRLRWEWAYKRGQHSFSHDGEGYLVFDLEGRPYPPQTCVEMVVDSFERASGNWFGIKGQPRKRTAGGLDFSDYGIKSRNGVLAFEKWAKSTPELFTHRRLQQKDRVPFKNRQGFFDYLVKNADLFNPGDIVAIQGLKRDGHIHQHAILITDTDPITGLPHRLTDQMKRPRLRSWEGIMAEAPLRSLLYHIQPTRTLLAKLDPKTRGGTSTETAHASTAP